jgi:hypothetical protein
MGPSEGKALMDRPDLMENRPNDRNEENRNDDNSQFDKFSFLLDETSHSWLQRQHMKSMVAFQISGLSSEIAALTTMKSHG